MSTPVSSSLAATPPKLAAADARLLGELYEAHADAIFRALARWGVREAALDDALQETFLATNSQRMESLSFVAPVAYTIDWLIFFSDKSKALTIGIVSCAGVVLGSALYALATRSFRWEGFRDARDTAQHLIGAALMGVGGVTALGCTIGQGLSGLSTLSLTSFVAVAAIIAGAVAGLKYQFWLVERSA